MNPLSQVQEAQGAWEAREPRARSRVKPVRVDSPNRVWNLAVAVALLVASAPLMILLALLIKLTSPGPVFYAQPRVGLDRRNGSAGGSGRRRIDYGGRLFRIFKFRTMYANGLPGRQTWARPNDPRVTPVGRVLRRYRLDELPQLFNVLRGDMNVVGPRPEQPAIFMKLREQLDGYERRQRVRPGITGWAQVNHHYDHSVDDVRRKLRFDLEYIERRSIREDFKILVRTVPVVVFRRGAW